MEQGQNTHKQWEQNWINNNKTLNLERTAAEATRGL